MLYKSKKLGLLLITLIYILTIAIAYLLFKVLPLSNSIIEILLINVICTIIIFAFSTIFKNSSIYDPYWSVSPVVMSIAYLVYENTFSLSTITLFVLICIWSVRLTINWAVGFTNLSHQDWRYQMFKEQKPKLFFLINLFGIHLFPTFVVSFGMIPTFEFFGKMSGSLMTVIAYVVIVIAILVETIADIQMMKFRKDEENKGKVMDKGLWKSARHPNYFGEILFWFGIFLCYFSLKDANIFLLTSPLVVFLLFQFISIPMMEKRQLSSKSYYKDYVKKTNSLLPIFPPKNKNS